MTKLEMHSILLGQLEPYRHWPYADLAAFVGEDCLAHTEYVSREGTAYQVEVQVFWDDKPHGNLRVMADMCAEPQRRLLGFLPVYLSDSSADFIMTPNGEFVGE